MNHSDNPPPTIDNTTNQQATINSHTVHEKNHDSTKQMADAWQAVSPSKKSRQSEVNQTTSTDIDVSPSRYSILADQEEELSEQDKTVADNVMEEGEIETHHYSKKMERRSS